MKRNIVILGIIIFVIALIIEGCPSNKQNPLSKEEQVKKRLEELFTICKSGEYSSAGEYLVYRGKDLERKWKDVYNYADSDEKNAVDNTCSRIKYDLDRFTSHEFTNYLIETESEGEWNIVEVTFKSEFMEEKRYYAFLDIKGKWALGDVD